MFRVLFSILLSVSVALAATDGPATLPLALPLSTMADTPAPGAVTLVTPGGLQQAINNAACGDTLKLPAGSNFAGNYSLPAKPCDDAHWVVIRSSAPDAALPSEGGRINPCYAGVASLPGRPTFTCPNGLVTVRITAGKGGNPITLLAGANHYRLGPGLELTRPTGTGIAFNLISVIQPADHLVVDRDWVHGTAQDDTMRGLVLSGVTNAAVVGSYFSDFHCTATIGACVDAQAIAGGNGPLPSGTFLIENNFLEGAAETILFGGTLKNSATPVDITVRRNHMFKPLTWMPGQPGFIGGVNTDPTKCVSFNEPGYCPFIVKNLFELKNAQRVLLEGNIAEYSWPGYSQHGAGILISGLNPPAAAGALVYSTVSVVDVTFRYNQVSHTTAGLSIVNMGIGTPLGYNLPVAHISVHDNILDDMSLDYLNNGDSPEADFHMIAVGSCPNCTSVKDISIFRNTILSKNPKMAFTMEVAGTQQLGLNFTDNIMSVPPGVAVTGSNATGCAYTGNTNLLRLNACLVPNYGFNGNILIGGTSTWPAGNYFPANLAAVGLNPNLSLSASSLYKGAATDGGNPGADAAKVHYATLGVE